MVWTEVIVEKEVCLCHKAKGKVVILRNVVMVKKLYSIYLFSQNHIKTYTIIENHIKILWSEVNGGDA